MDWFSVVSLGSYSKPGIPASERAALFSTYGLFDTLGATAPGSGQVYVLRNILRGILCDILQPVFGEE